MRRALATFVALGLCLAPASAQAFDTGPHADMTRDALTAEGFGRAGANVGMVNNWFVDYYTNPDDNPYSGHANALVGLLRFGFNREDWLHQWVEGAQRMHFDAGIRQVGMPDLSTTAGIDKDKIEVEVESFETNQSATLQRAWIERQGPVRAGTTVPLKVLLRNYRGETHTQTIPVAVPASAPAGTSIICFADSDPWRSSVCCACSVSCAAP